MSPFKSSKGSAFAGMLVVVAIIAVLAMTLVSQARKEVVDAGIETVQTRINTLNAVVKRYYDARCADALFVQPTVVILLNQGYLRALSSINIPESTAQTILINNPGTQFVSFTYTATFADGGTAQRVAGFSPSARQVGQVVSWTYQNSALDTDESVESFEYLSAFGAQVCQ